jgi:AcrR family transcriptional regulator
MRKPRNGPDTQQRVLSSAQSLFAARGFAGTSLADISQACGISDGLILHHFHSKRNLYHQVLESLAEEYTRALVQANEAATSPQERLQQTLTASFNFWKQDSAYQRISLWAYLEGQTEFAEKEARLTAGLAQSVQQLQEQGLLDDRFSPMVLLTMVIGPIHFWLRYREQFRASLGLTGSSDDLDTLFLSQFIQLITEMSPKMKIASSQTGD